MKLSMQQEQDVLLAIHDKENNKLVIYQSQQEFNTMEVTKLLRSEKTRLNYEEFTNKNFKQHGKLKMQTYHLRLDNNT
jgi:hypothetical protein